MTAAQYIQIALAFVASGGFGAWIVGYFNRGKTKAETEQIATNVYKGLNSDLLSQLKDANTEIRRLTKEGREMEHRLAVMEDKDEEKERELLEKNKKIVELEGRIVYLESELKKYKPIDEVIDSVAHAAHVKIDEAKDEIKSNLIQ